MKLHHHDGIHHNLTSAAALVASHPTVLGWQLPRIQPQTDPDPMQRLLARMNARQRMAKQRQRSFLERISSQLAALPPPIAGKELVVPEVVLTVVPPPFRWIWAVPGVIPGIIPGVGLPLLRTPVALA